MDRLEAGEESAGATRLTVSGYTGKVLYAGNVDESDCEVVGNQYRHSVVVRRFCGQYLLHMAVISPKSFGN